ncbi:MAG: helix-turn-helix domain-containing protein [Akkermansiaceae bacterium]|nr:helix-turn-helix domain-containing protein [Verrucomicrobiales bacterium]
MNARKCEVVFARSTPAAHVAMSLNPPRESRRPDLSTLPLRPLHTPPWSAVADAGKHSIRSIQWVENLAGTPDFREFQRAFEDATRLPLTLRAVEGWQLAHRGSRHQNGFCAMMSQANRSCAACLQTQQRVCEGSRDKPCTMACTFGIIETAVAVRIGHEIIAYLQTGQIFFKAPTPQQTRAALRQLKDWGLDIDMAEAAGRYNETPVVSRGDYQARIRLLQFFADHLGTSAHQILLRQQTAEPVQITRARQFIAEHYQEYLCLTDVAREVGMSTFYLCKKFKSATGMNFTPYVSAIRVEQAKQLLLNAHYRISEIAFAVGFQSLTHFNRIFKDTVGYSPSEYRQHLPTTQRERKVVPPFNLIPRVQTSSVLPERGRLLRVSA